MGTVRSSHQERGSSERGGGVIDTSTRTRASHVGLLLLAAFGLLLLWWFLHAARASALSTKPVVVTHDIVIRHLPVHALQLADPAPSVDALTTTADPVSPPPPPAPDARPSVPAPPVEP